MRIIVALGGNAMTGPDGNASPAAQQAAVAVAMEAVADLVAAGHEVVLTHGNGPQVGNLLVKNELAASVVPPVPLDWCVAQTQATLGLTIMDALDVALSARGVDRPVATVVTRTLVDGQDPAAARPTKPVGRYLPAAEAAVLVGHGQTWHDRGDRGMAPDGPQPEPIEVLDVAAVRLLLAGGAVVVCAGGGGIPTVRDADGRTHGLEAVIDKDLTAAVLDRALAADVLVIATDVDAVVLGFGTKTARPLGRTTPVDLRAHAAAGEFGSGSMGPKVEAACRFVEAGGGRAVITSLDRIAGAIDGEAGTVIESATPDPVHNKE